MVPLSLVLILACGPTAAWGASLRLGNASGLAAAASSRPPMHALIEELGARAEVHGAASDPELGYLNQRLAKFAEAIHFAAQQKRSHHGAKVATKRVRKDDGKASKGSSFEEVEKDKACAPGGKISTYRRKVKSAEDCITPCAEEAGCVAFAYYQKPQKMCELFSTCGELEDVNIIRGVHLWGIKGDGDSITDSGTCGKLKDFPNSKPDISVDTTARAYLTGDKVKYVCDRDHTIDGSKDGAKDFMVDCAEQNYYVPERKGCVGASECGSMPCVRKAHITGKVEGTSKNPKVELVCDDGYSLDGEKVVAGGNLNNAHLYLECTFAGTWSVPTNYLGKKGKACEPFAFVPASGMIKMYNKVFEVLFIASCNTELTKWAEMKEEVPPKLKDGTVCGEYVADDKEGDCKGLVTDLKTLFKDAKGADNDGFDAKGFCKDMWDLLKMEEPAAKTC